MHNELSSATNVIQCTEYESEIILSPIQILCIVSFFFKWATRNIGPLTKTNRKFHTNWQFAIKFACTSSKSRYDWSVWFIQAMKIFNENRLFISICGVFNTMVLSPQINSPGAAVHHVHTKMSAFLSSFKSLLPNENQTTWNFRNCRIFNAFFGLNRSNNFIYFSWCGNLCFR